MSPSESSVATIDDTANVSPADGMLAPEPMDPQITSIQPGDAHIVHLELAWGHIRRWWLKKFRPEFVARMRACRQGEESRCPHEVLDPRDVKFFRNQGGYWWRAADDPFKWRDRIPFARTGLAELQVCSIAGFGGAAVLAVLAATQPITGVIGLAFWLAAAALVVVGTLIVWFFRDPPRSIPTEPGTLVSPADGKLVTIERIKHDEFLGGPAVMLGVFLSIFNVHINRSPLPTRVIGLTYRRGKYLNALKPESVRENERLEVRLQSTENPAYRFRLRQISGAIARRIVCWLKPGDEMAVGEQFGMIKLGSRTELILPDVPELEILINVGDKVYAGSTVVGRFHQAPTGAMDRSTLNPQPSTLDP